MASWHDLFPGDPGALRPAEWRIRAVGRTVVPRVYPGPDVWFIDAAVRDDETAKSVIDKICRCVVAVIEGNRAEPTRSTAPPEWLLCPLSVWAAAAWAMIAAPSSTHSCGRDGGSRPRQSS